MCETTCYKEPILVYRPGSVFNIYQIMFETTLPINYMAISCTSFKEAKNCQEIHFSTCDEDYFRIGSYAVHEKEIEKNLQEEKSPDQIELLSISSEAFL